MNNNSYNQLGTSDSATRFAGSPMAEIEFSTVTASPQVLTTLNASELVPIMILETLPGSKFKIDFDFVCRLVSPTVSPTMAECDIDFYCFEVPNRVVNRDWENVQGANTSGAWVPPPDVKSAPLYVPQSGSAGIKINVESVADYMGLPTQDTIPASILASMNDMPFRGYPIIYNEFFRDQNYEAPIAISKLNVYNGVLEPVGTTIGFGSTYVAGNTETFAAAAADGTVGAGSITKAIYGDGGSANGSIVLPKRTVQFSANARPLKVNKLHDYFTSGLPSTQKGAAVVIGVADSSFPVKFDFSNNTFWASSGSPLKLVPQSLGNVSGSSGWTNLVTNRDSGSSSYREVALSNTANAGVAANSSILGMNLVGSVDISSTGINISDLREAFALQHVYEILARGGSRYEEFLRSMFGLEINNAFKNIPTFCWKVTRQLRLFQTAQTSPSSDSPQSSLTAFGYTSSGENRLQEIQCLEYGYIHIYAVIRHKNVYSSMIAKHWFREKLTDYYLPPLANIGEQPIFTKQINPFVSQDLLPEGVTPNSAVFAYQEAHAEYRFEPSRVSGFMRPGINGTLAADNYADDFDDSIVVLNSNWLKSNTEQVLNRSLAIDSSKASQFKLQVQFQITKTLPMPTYSVPGLDII